MTPQLLPGQRKRRFLDALARGLSVGCAARAAGIRRSTAYAWRQRDPQFAAAWVEALETATDALETEAFRRAKDKSDMLVAFFLRARRPGVYAPRQRVELSGNAAMNVQQSVEGEAAALLKTLADRLAHVPAVVDLKAEDVEDAEADPEALRRELMRRMPVAGDSGGDG